MNKRRVNDLFENFQSTLKAIVPMAEHIDMTWKNENAYDEWENIEQTLFNSFVVSPLTHNIDSRTINLFVPYAMHVKSIKLYSYFGFKSDGRLWRFLGFKTEKKAFDLLLFENFDVNSLEFLGEKILLPFERTNVDCFFSKKIGI